MLPQILLLILIAIVLFDRYMRNGIAREYDYAATIWKAIALLALLVWGGFFSVMFK